MCVVSVVMDDWINRHPPVTFTYTPSYGPTREEFEALKTELESLKKLLTAAKQYDEETGQPNCEDAKKVALIKQLADLIGVDLSKVLA